MSMLAFHVKVAKSFLTLWRPLVFGDF